MRGDPPESILGCNINSKIVFHNLLLISAANKDLSGRLEGSLCNTMYTAFLNNVLAEVQVNLPPMPAVSRAKKRKAQSVRIL